MAPDSSSQFLVIPCSSEPKHQKLEPVMLLVWEAKIEALLLYLACDPHLNHTWAMCQALGYMGFFSLVLA